MNGLESQETTVSDQITVVFEFVQRSLRHYRKGVLVCIIGGVAAFGAALMASHTYRSEAVILYRESIDASFVTGQSHQGAGYVRTLSETLQEQLMARPELKKMIKKFKLYPKIVDERGFLPAEDLLRKNISISLGAGDTFRVSFMGPKQDTVFKLTKDLSERMVAEEERMRNEQAQSAVRFLENQRKEAEKKLKGKEEELAQFLAKHPEFAEDSGASSTGASVRAESEAKRKGKKVDPVLSTLQGQLSRIKGMLANPQKPTVVIEDSEWVAQQRRAMEEMQQAEGELRAVRDKYTEQHPDVATSKARLVSARARYKEISLRKPKPIVREPLDKEQVTQMEERMRDLQKQIARYKRKGSEDSAEEEKSKANADSIVELETNWARLNREGQEEREAYLRLEDRAFRAKLNADSASRAPAMRIIDPAYFPKHPITMGRTKVLMLGCVASFFLALGMMVLFALMDDRIYTPRDVEQLGMGKILAVLPKPSRQEMKRIRQGARLYAQQAKEMAATGDQPAGFIAKGDPPSSDSPPPA